jgi:hypothetical protein
MHDYGCRNIDRDRRLQRFNLQRKNFPGSSLNSFTGVLDSVCYGRSRSLGLGICRSRGCLRRCFYLCPELSDQVSQGRGALRRQSLDRYQPSIATGLPGENFRGATPCSQMPTRGGPDETSNTSTAAQNIRTMGTKIATISAHSTR